MEIVKAKEMYLNEIMKLISDCVKDMRGRGLFQWDEKYPNLGVIKEDIRNGDGYVVIDENRIAAYFCINENQAEEYKTLTWSIISGRMLVLHRLSVNPVYQQRGIGSLVMKYIQEHGIKKGYSSVRLDTYSVNSEANKLYVKCGYNFVGQVYFPDRERPFYCYEKKL